LFPIGVITALESEAKCLQGVANTNHFININSGIGPDAANTGAQSAFDAGCRSLVSFGYAGALNTGLKPGDLLVGVSVSNGNLTLESEPLMVSQLTSVLKSGSDLVALESSLLSTSAITDTVSEKASRRAEGAWDAVDMESYSIASVAAQQNLPFLIVRAVLDTAVMELPAEINSLIDTNGLTRPAAALAAVVNNPKLISDLAILARNRRKADQTLRGVVPFLVRAFT